MCTLRRSVARSTFTALAALLAGAARADIITFETIPGATPSEGLGVSDQYAHGTGSIRPTFLLTNFVPARMGKYGVPLIAFEGHGGGADAPAPGADVGQYFLTNYAGTGGPQNGLNIGFSSMVARVAGVLLDVDGSDEWTVEALGPTGAVAATAVVGPTGPGGATSRWSIELPTASIGAVRITYTGISPAGVGLALDNLAFSNSPCRADINYDGFVDGIDSDLFHNLFEAGAADADYNGDGFVDGIDADQFDNDFAGGC